METSLIPPSLEGKQNDLFAKRQCEKQEEARVCFHRAKKRLLNPRTWHELAGVLSAEFVLVDEKGNQPRRLAEQGDLYRINLPGPGPQAGNGYDWVRVDEIEDRSHDNAAEELFAMRVSPTVNPYNDSPVTAHFFKTGASSTFVVQRTGNEVTASYHGRNEVANNETPRVLDNARNTIMGSAALMGLSELQWSTMIKALLEPELGG